MVICISTTIISICEFDEWICTNSPTVQYIMVSIIHINILRPKMPRRAITTAEIVLFHENFKVWFQLKFYCKVPTDNMSKLVQIRARCRISKHRAQWWPSLLTHICVTWDLMGVAWLCGHQDFDSDIKVPSTHKVKILTQSFVTSSLSYFTETSGRHGHRYIFTKCIV